MVRNVYLQVPILLKRMSQVGQMNFILEIPILSSPRGLAKVLKMNPTTLTCGKRLCFILDTTFSAGLLAWNSQMNSVCVIIASSRLEEIRPKPSYLENLSFCFGNENIDLQQGRNRVDSENN